jgi:hypothetical protein
MTLQNMRRWLPTARDLDEQQTQVIIDCVNHGDRLVYGPAGSGKTAIALHCANVLHKSGRSFRIIVYTNLLLKFIAAGASDLALPSDCVTTFYRWVRELHVRYIGTPPHDPNDMFSRWVDNLVAYWRRYPAIVPKYEFLLIDEAQDFKDNVATLLHMLSSNLMIFADSAQSLYVDTVDRAALLKRWAPVGATYDIPHNYRNPLSIARVAALFLDTRVNSPSRFLQCVKGRDYDHKPEWHQVANEQGQIDKICELIRETRGSVRIGILYRHRRDLEHDQRALAQRHIPVQIGLPQTDTINFNVCLPVLITAHSAKGMEFDQVILPWLDSDKWDGDAMNVHERNLFFVALTRANERLYMVATRGKECAFLTEITGNHPELIQTPGSTSVDRRVYHSAVAQVDEDSPF